MFELGRKPSQVILVRFTSKIAKIAKVKCTHRTTNPFDASISTIARLPWVHPFICWNIAGHDPVPG